VSAEEAQAKERHQRTREKLRQLLRDGQLEQREVEVEVPVQGPGFDALGQAGAPEGMQNFAEMLSEMLPKRTKQRTVPVAEARRILLDQEFDKLINLDDVTAEALERTESMGIVFLDEIDKIAGGQRDNGWTRRLARGGATRPPPDRRGIERPDEVRDGEDRPCPLRRGRGVPCVQAE